MNTSGLQMNMANQTALFQKWKQMGKSLSVSNVRRAAYSLWGEEIGLTEEEKLSIQLERDSSSLTQSEFVQKHKPNYAPGTWADQTARPSKGGE
jgi:hypothetical protein